MVFIKKKHRKKQKQHRKKQKQPRKNKNPLREEDFKNKLEEHTEKARLQCKAELREREGKIASREMQVIKLIQKSIY